MTNPRTGKIERVFVNLEAVYPNPNDPNEEMSFEELRAQSRGWLEKDWAAERRNEKQASSISSTIPAAISSPALNAEIVGGDTPDGQQLSDMVENTESRVDVASSKENARESKPGRPKKMKVMEVKGETQTSEIGDS